MDRDKGDPNTGMKCIFCCYWKTYISGKVREITVQKTHREKYWLFLIFKAHSHWIGKILNGVKSSPANDMKGSVLKDFPSRSVFKVFPLKKKVTILKLIMVKTHYSRWAGIYGSTWKSCLKCPSLMITWILKCLSMIAFCTNVFHIW